MRRMTIGEIAMAMMVATSSALAVACVGQEDVGEEDLSIGRVELPLKGVSAQPQ